MAGSITGEMYKAMVGVKREFKSTLVTYQEQMQTYAQVKAFEEFRN